MSQQKITTFLMFEGRAEEAINYYASIFENAGIVHIQRYGPGEAGPEGSVFHATFRLHGQQFMAIDSPAKHGFTFTPAISMWVDCETEAEVEKYFGALSEGGAVLMPLGAYPFARKFAWVQDKFGVTWQLSLSA
ncbi:MAG: 3-demethylubiquinone-9 3-methyltransferase [Symbiobacteriaceae bacterium]|nr:3-demethylubiquinone-9 3-methyltransferase [Symbiobacteriaceae bacterium]